MIMATAGLALKGLLSVSCDFSKKNDYNRPTEAKCELCYSVEVIKECRPVKYALKNKLNIFLYVYSIYNIVTNFIKTMTKYNTYIWLVGHQISTGNKGVIKFKLYFTILLILTNVNDG